MFTYAPGIYNTAATRNHELLIPLARTMMLYFHLTWHMAAKFGVNQASCNVNKIFKLQNRALTGFTRNLENDPFFEKLWENLEKYL